MRSMHTQLPQLMREILRSRLGTFALLMLIGAGVFFAYGGGAMLNPTQIGWIMCKADHAQHHLGWVYFRHTPLWQWPLGANPNCGLELSSSIVFTDSIPLLAFTFKALRTLLPETFQYLGPWTLVCFLAQTYFGWCLAATLTRNRASRLLMAAFFALSPILVWRQFCQTSHSAHWLILGAIYFNFRRNFADLRWVALLGCAALTSIYFLPMTAALLLCDVLARGRAAWRKTLPILFAAPAFAVLALDATGAFMVSASGLRKASIEHFRADILAFFNPTTLWSITLPDLQIRDPYMEGFLYLGGGMLALVLLALVLLCCRQSTRKCSWATATITRRRVRILAVCAVGFFAISLSDYVSLLGYELFTYECEPLMQLVRMFRAVGRMAWVPYYLLYLGIFAVLARQLSAKWLTIALSVALVFQLVDSAKSYPHFLKARYNKHYEPALVSDFWEQAARKYRKLRLIYPSCNIEPNWLTFAYYGATHNIGINSFYLARYDKAAINAETNLLHETLRGKRPLAHDTLYIVRDNNPGAWVSAANIATRQGFKAQRIDGIKVLYKE